jgi:hypothetical protein
MTDMPKMSAYGESLKALVLFVSDISSDKNQPQELRDKAEKIVTDYLFAAVMSLADKKEPA